MSEELKEIGLIQELCPIVSASIAVRHTVEKAQFHFKLMDRAPQTNIHPLVFASSVYPFLFAAKRFGNLYFWGT